MTGRTFQVGDRVTLQLDDTWAVGARESMHGMSGTVEEIAPNGGVPVGSTPYRVRLDCTPKPWWGNHPGRVWLCAASDLVPAAVPVLTRRQLEALVWRHTHRDYRGGAGAGRTVLHQVPESGTCTVLLSRLTDAELMAKLPAKVRASLEPAGEPA